MITLRSHNKVLDAVDPGLGPFRPRGGKLLTHPKMELEYYEEVREKMGAGTFTFDTATPIVQWVEEGKPPDSIPAARVVGGQIVRTRPLCAWPEVARYKGSGSIDDAANFACGRAE